MRRDARASQCSNWIIIFLTSTLWLAVSGSASAQVAEFRELFDPHPSIMLLVDSDTGQIVDANQSAVSFYGYDRAKLFDLRIQQLNTLSSEQVAEERALAASESRNFFVFRHKLANGELRTVQLYSAPFGNDQRPLLLSIVHDITVGAANLEQGMWRYQQQLEMLVDEQLAESENRQRTIILLSCLSLILVSALVVS